jgi:peroxiredoxin Q/BCP
MDSAAPRGQTSRMTTPRLRTTTPLLAILALPILAAAPLHAADDLLAVGAAAPDLIGKDTAGAPVKLSAQKGRFAVVYFYPKDETLGCTKEACAFRDAFDKFVKADVTIFAVSRDPEASHRAFREHYKLPFPMVADDSGAVQRAYGVPAVKPGVDIAARVTFLVGPDGKIARIWPKVDPVVNAGEVLGAVAALQPKHKS